MEPGSVLGVCAGQRAGGGGGCDKPLLLQNVASRAMHISRTQGASQTDRLEGSPNSSPKLERELGNAGLLSGNRRPNTPPGPGVDVLQAGGPLPGWSEWLPPASAPSYCSEIPDQNHCVLSLSRWRGAAARGAQHSPRCHQCMWHSLNCHRTGLVWF